MRRNLVLARCGQASLHHTWLEDAAKRNWDLVLSPYQEITPTVQPDIVLPVTAGQKWAGLNQTLQTWPDWRQYEYIWLPDDDLLADTLRINLLFAHAEAFGAALCAPALSEDSYFSHIVTMKNRSFTARSVTFIEVMMPCFHRNTLERILPVLADVCNGIGDGWGMDFVWAKLLDYKDLYIFDDIVVQHTRPVGAARNEVHNATVWAEMEKMLEKYDARRLFKTLHGYKPEGLVLYNSKQDFLDDYVDGYCYLNKNIDKYFSFQKKRKLIRMISNEQFS